MANESGTIITFRDSGDTANIYTSSRAWIRRLAGLAAEFPDVFVLIQEDEYEVMYRVPKNLFTIK